MLRYFLNRLFFSGFIIVGVMLLTFVLFKLAAGDPAAALLGKNPSAREIEDMRMELGSDKPIIYGKWRRTEAFSSGDFSRPRRVKNIAINGQSDYQAGYLKLAPGGTVTFTRNFQLEEVNLQGEIYFRGAFTVDGNEFIAENWQQVSIPVTGRKTFAMQVPAAGAVLELKTVNFYREQGSALNSQLLDSFRELVSFKAEFPYISFFNFGKTLITREPVSKIIWRGLWPSLSLMLPIFFGEIIIGIALALFATAYKDSLADRLTVLVSIAGMSVSYLVFIIFGQWYLGYYFNLFPVWGWGGLRFLALPVLIGICSGLGGGVRFYRTVFVNELNREYLRTATAKGCSKLTIYSKHLLRNAMIPIITRASASLPFLFTGSLLLERFFGIPGLGYAGLDALDNSDLQLLKALVVITALLFVAMNLFADIAYAWFDPRIRLDKGGS
ncbi:MAG: ABC transporter permease [Victivallaceae bacterium]|nr:ABC transporter permease [Victivallaceae bacterium]